MLSTTWPLHYLPVLLLLCVQITSAILVNVTVDDSGPDPITGLQIAYFPPSDWSVGPNCTTCAAHPDPSGAFNRSWHDGFLDPRMNDILSAVFAFQGSALYVNCILGPEAAFSTVVTTDITFFLDGHFAGSFFRPPNGNPNFEFNVTVYANTSIPYGNHTFALQNGRVGGTGSSVLLDSITYTYDTSQITTSPLSQHPTNAAPSPTSSNPLSGNLSATTTIEPPKFTVANDASSQTSHILSSKTRVVAIVVPVIGGVLLITLAVLLFFWRRRRYQKYSLPMDMVPPTNTDPIGEDPSSSGWAEGTWPKDEEPIHPSLMPLPSERVPLGRSGDGGASTSSHWSQPSADLSSRTGSTIPSRSTSATAVQVPRPPTSYGGHDRMGAAGSGSGITPTGSASWHGHQSQDDGNDVVVIHAPPHPFATATPSSPSYPHFPRSPQGSSSVASPALSSLPSSRSETPLVTKFIPNRRAVVLPSLKRSASAVVSIPENASRDL